jgi:cytochrome P450
MTKPSLPPGPTDWMVHRLYKAWATDPLEYMADVPIKYGDIAYMKLGNNQLAQVNHPDFVQDILVTHRWNFAKRRVDEKEWRQFLGEGLLDSRSDFHAHQRRLLEHAFRHERIAAHGAVMSDYARRISANWADGATLDIHREMMRLTLAIGGKAFLGADVESGEADSVGRAVEMAYESQNFVKLPFAHLLRKLPLPSVRHFRQAREILDDVIYRQIEARRRSGTEGDDLLSMLIHSPELTGTSSRFTDVLVRDEALTMLLAGHETTANALTFTWYLLAQNPEAEARLHAEVDAVLGARPATVADVPKLPYTEAVFAESLRLYPPVWAQARSSVSEYILGGYLLPAETIVMWSWYTIQRDPRWFEAPDKFMPERMTHEARAARHRYAYSPFGGGTRQCIGEAFAWMEAVLVLATLAQRWKLRSLPDHELVLEPLITLRPRGGLPMSVEKRH